MSKVKSDLLYTDTHEWVSVENDIATFGIDDFSQAQTGEIVYVDLPQVGASFSMGDEICVVESVKSASDVYTPISGEVVEKNTKLEERPILINEDCYHNGWLVKIKIKDKKELESLLSAKAYKEKLNNLAS